MTTTINGYPIDIALSVKYSRKTLVTRDPVERGEPVTDHVASDPPELEFEGLVSDTPLAAIASDPSRRSLSGDLKPSQDAFSQLQDLQELGEPFTVGCSLGVFEEMVIGSLTTTKDAKTSRAFKFTVTFTRVNIRENARTTTAIPGGTDFGLSADHLVEGNKALWRKGRPPGHSPATEPPGVIVGQEVVTVTDKLVRHQSGVALTAQEMKDFALDLQRDTFFFQNRQLERLRRKNEAQGKRIEAARELLKKKQREADSKAVQKEIRKIKSPGKRPDPALFGR